MWYKELNSIRLELDSTGTVHKICMTFSKECKTCRITSFNVRSLITHSLHESSLSWNIAYLFCRATIKHNQHGCRIANNTSSKVFFFFSFPAKLRRVIHSVFPLCLTPFWMSFTDTRLVITLPTSHMLWFSDWLNAYPMVPSSVDTAPWKSVKPVQKNRTIFLVSQKKLNRRVLVL